MDAPVNQRRPAEAAAPSPSSPDWTSDLDNVLRLAAAQDRRSGLGPDGEEDAWIETLDLVVQATDTIRASEDRIAKLEARNRELETRLAEEVKSLQARMQATDKVIERAAAARVAAEDRARRAEERAETAEKFLSRINQALRPLAR